MSEANPAASAVIIAAAAELPQPTVKVNIHAGTLGATETIAVPDTGAMVCVAGLNLMLALGLSKNKLTKCGKLKDVAGRPINAFGHFHCRIDLNGKQSYQRIYFIPEAKSCFLSLTTCKDLKLVHEAFPDQLPTVASVANHLISRATSAEEHSVAPSSAVALMPQLKASSSSSSRSSSSKATNCHQAPMRPEEVPIPPL